MKAYLYYPFTILIFFSLIMMACRSTKRLKDNEALVTKLIVRGVDDRFDAQAADFVAVNIRPNSAFNLWVYNTFNKKGNKKLGEAPHILDSSLVEVSRIQIQKFLNIKGFLNATVKDSIHIENKKAELIYTVQQGTEFKFRNLSFDIPDTSVKNLYLKNRSSFTRIDSGKRYDVDSLSFERERIYLLLKQNGYYDFLRQYVRPVVDTNFNKGVADVELNILNPDNGQKHQLYNIGNSVVRIQPSSGIILEEMVPDSAIIDSQYRFYDYSHFFKPKKIAPYIFLDEGELYNIDNSELTTKRLFDLNVFKNVSVNYRKSSDSSNTLIGLIDILPLKKKSNRLDGEYTFNSSITGANTGVTYQNKNIFGGAELFEVKFRIGIQFDKNKSGSFSDRLLSRDYQFGASLSFPRLITPFHIPSFGRNGLPATRIGTSYQIYKLTDAYLRRSLGATLTYDWVETANKQHSFTPINVQYSQGDINPDLIDELIRNGNLFFIYTLRSQLITSSYYNFTLNLPKLNSLGNFIFYNANAELGGTASSLLAKISPNENLDAQKLLFGVPYYQFARLTSDVRFYRHLGGEKQFILRMNGGVGYAFGNVKSLPFDKKFFAGGSSGIRAWQARTLGPGNYNRASLPSNISRNNLRNLDQIGDIKFETNIEYRFGILDNFIGGKLKGAAFLDFGNIWELRDQTNTANSKIDFSRIFDQTAIGPGLGIRYDLSFFVVRIDAGFKFKDPQFTGNDQYIYKYWFNKPRREEFKANYEITNSPDKYSITQIQFGIGLPF